MNNIDFYVVSDGTQLMHTALIRFLISEGILSSTNQNEYLEYEDTYPDEFVCVETKMEGNIGISTAYRSSKIPFNYRILFDKANSRFPQIRFSISISSRR